MKSDIQLIGLLALRLLFQTLVASFLVDEDDRAEDHDLGTDAEERPQCSQLICLHSSTISAS